MTRITSSVQLKRKLCFLACATFQALFLIQDKGEPLAALNEH